MYLLIALAVTVVVLALAWRGLDGARPSESSGSEPRGQQPPPAPRPKTRSIAPDDDPEFLREIDRKIRGGEDINGSGGAGASA